VSTSDRLTPSLRDRLRSLLGSRGWPRTLALRRVTATALVLLAAALALRPGSARGQPTVPMLVAAHDLAPGATLGLGDVRLVDVPGDVRPPAALGSTDEVTGRVLAGVATAGEPITRARLVGPENTRLATGNPDAVAVPIRLADPAVADLLNPGARVDVVAADPRGSLLASDATVITVLADAKPDRLVVVAMPRDTATKVASASLGQEVTVTLR
jgi:Flp pilus assembly protein CpaB